MFFLLISFVLGSRRKRSFQWNMGLKVLPTQEVIGINIVNAFPGGQAWTYWSKVGTAYLALKRSNKLVRGWLCQNIIVFQLEPTDLTIAHLQTLDHSRLQVHTPLHPWPLLLYYVF